MKDKEVIIKLEDAYEKVYPIRASGGAFEVSIPKVVIEREAKRLGCDVEDLVVRWLFNNFKGLYAVLERKKKKE